MENYRTRDLYLSAFLIISEISLSYVEFDPSGGFYWFVFENHPKCLQLENEFSVGSPVSDVRKYAQSVRYLKKLISDRNPNYSNNHSNSNGTNIYNSR